MNDVDLAAEICPGNPLDPGIARVVKTLIDAGVHTFESCEGGDSHSFRDPTVKFYGSPAEGWRALAACLDVGLPVRSLERTWDMDDGEPSGPYWKLVLRAPRVSEGTPQKAKHELRADRLCL